ncbi:aminopeptidase N [Kocuria tytonis]|uniref:Aminopeptidase N n=1 Tax=Kocuria tytonis TaxID=2054280 RepID=A0A495A8S8_9MICC|nr:aminopeptidase N [Kocuria tytonis]RKQ36407.1 aminopeptidase N [Kocuria tytonis]
MGASLTREEAATRAEQIRVEDYRVTVDLSGAKDPGNTTFGSEVTVRFTAEEGAETFIDFIHDSVTAVELNGEVLDVDDIVTGSRIRLPELGQANELRVAGRALYSRSGEGLHRYIDPQDGEVYIYTQYEPADCRRVFAVFEQPDLKASFQFSVIAPEGWLAASNGELVSSAPGADAEFPGAVTHEFAPTQRISSYITTILAGPYTRVTDEWCGTDPQGEAVTVPLALYCRRALAEHMDAEELFALTRQGLDFFPELFGFAYPWGKYEQAFVPEYNLGAMENPGMVTFTEDYLFPSGATRAQLAGRANTLMHEMSHMWFGDLVTMRWWDDLWLKESFAEFMGAYACVHATQYTDAWVTFALARKEWAYRQDQLRTTHPIVADIVDLEAARQNFDGITYAKGASVLKQLVAFVGEASFMDACRAYFRRFAFGNTSLDDFLGVLDEACEHDVRAWAELWLRTTGVPVLTVRRDDAAAASLTQSAAPLRPHVLTAGSYARENGSGAVVNTARVEVRVPAEKRATELTGLAGAAAPGAATSGTADPGGRNPAPEVPSGAVSPGGGASAPTTSDPARPGEAPGSVLLVNDTDLTYCLAHPDPASLAGLLELVGDIADPLARAVAHSQLWAAVRDGRLCPREYVLMVARRCTTEQHAAVLTTVLEHARQALGQYVPVSYRTTVRRTLLDALGESMLAAGPGSDAQLILARAFAREAARDGKYARPIQEWLGGERAVPGLELTPQLRWTMLTAVTATGHSTVSELEAEHARDRTRDGHLGHLEAVAAMRSDRSKEQAWQRIVSGELSNDELSATIAGFQLAAPAVLRRYEDTYFEQLTTWWATRSMEIATRMVRGLYPRAVDAQAASSSPAEAAAQHPVVRGTDAWLREHREAPDALRRIVTELLDDAQRALTLQITCLSR